MAMEEETLRRVKSDVRSVLLSAPRGVLKRNFRREYMSLVGQDIPLGKLGIKSMDEFVLHNPDVVREVIGSTGEPTYVVVANAQTQHVASLVARQKKPSLKALRKATPVRRSMPKRRSYNSTYSRPAPSKAYRLTGQPSRPPLNLDRLAGPPLLRGPIFNQNRTPPQGQSSTLSGFVPAGAEASNQRVSTNCLSRSSKVEPNRGIPPWKEEYRTAFVFDCVDDVIRSKGQCKDKLICVTGYPADHDKITQYDGEFRVLLYNNMIKSRPKAPVLNTFFGNGWWKIKEYGDPYTLPPRGGCKLKVWGILQYKFWQNRGDFRHSLKGVYYEYVHTGNRTVSSGGQDLKITVVGSTAARGSDHSPTMIRLSSNSSIDSYTDFSSTYSGRLSPVASSLQEWLRDQLKDKQNGLWGKILVNQYKKDFKTEPPQNLLKEICSQPFIKFEESVKDNPIVYLDEEEISPPVPDYAELPISDKDWIDVLVVCVNDPCDFYVQHLSDKCSKALEKLTEDMNIYYNRSSSSIKGVTNVCRDTLYGVCWTESSEWCRALILDDPDSQSMVHVRYPDYGNEDKIPVSSLYKLPHQFYRLSMQAIHCSLIDFTDVSDKAIELFSELTFEKCCAVMVIERSCDQYTIDLIPPDTDDSIMDLIGQALHPVEGLAPHLPKVNDGRVSVKLREICLSDHGYVFVNIIGRGTEILNRILNTMDEHYQGAKVHEVSHNQLKKDELKVGMLCCAEFEGHWHRVRVTKLSPKSVSVQYIDYGTEEVDPPHLMKPPNDHYWNNLPPQAIKCKLHGIECKHKDVDMFNGYVLGYLQNYLEQELYLEMVNDTECILYDQLNDRNINEDIVQQYVTSSQPSPKLSQSSPRPLPPAPLPLSNVAPPLSSEDQHSSKKDSLAYTQSLMNHSDDVFLVNVSHCISPQEFTIQLLSVYEKLNRLQENIQEYCNSDSPPKLNEFEQGNVGIGRYHGDKQWYRVLLKDTLRLTRGSDGKFIKEIPVLFVDYGNEGFINEVLMITNNHLNQIPFQGIPAKLHIPDGATLQCSNDRFVRLTHEKQFHCHVKEFDKDMKRYSVSLMDTITNKLLWELL